MFIWPLSRLVLRDLCGCRRNPSRSCLCKRWFRRFAECLTTIAVVVLAEAYSWPHLGSKQEFTSNIRLILRTGSLAWKSSGLLTVFLHHNSQIGISRRCFSLLPWSMRLRRLLLLLLPNSYLKFFSRGSYALYPGALVALRTRCATDSAPPVLSAPDPVLLLYWFQLYRFFVLDAPDCPYCPQW